MGDDKKVVKHEKSIMSSPVVFGIKKGLAESLGFIGRQVSVNDILLAAENGSLRFAMTSATQSNSGACAYLGFLAAILGKNTPVTSSDLQNDALQAGVKKLLSGVNRSSGSSDWLKELLVENPESFDAMVNYESLVIAANSELTAKGKEPLYIIYPYDGMSLSDSPLGYIDKGSGAQEEAFLKLQEYLLSEAVQKKLNDLGRRTGLTLNIENPNPRVWNKDWGVDTERILSFINLPPKEVILEALNLYQTALKKPSATVYCLDYSGSMAGKGNEQLIEAMHTILDQSVAAQYMLQNTKDDYTAVIAFSDRTLGEKDCTGNSQQEMLALYDWVKSLNPDGGTDIYSPLIEAFAILDSFDSSYIKSVVLMTDGESNMGMTAEQFEHYYLENNGAAPPVFSIMFGSASDKQLSKLAEWTMARVFDGRKDMIAAFKQVRGYN
jgi:Ca-activated chloride channel family protein